MNIKLELQESHSVGSPDGNLKASPQQEDWPSWPGSANGFTAADDECDGLETPERELETPGCDMKMEDETKTHFAGVTVKLEPEDVSMSPALPPLSFDSMMHEEPIEESQGTLNVFCPGFNITAGVSLGNGGRSSPASPASSVGASTAQSDMTVPNSRRKGRHDRVTPEEEVDLVLSLQVPEAYEVLCWAM